jgi:glycosyltransferase involved in cell wall biosynthesis
MFNKNQPPTLSVIVPVYNGGNFLKRSLTAIINSDYHALEVIVANDGSTDDSAAISRRMGVKVIDSPHSQSGPAAARNAAAEIAQGEILVFIDADVVVKRETLGKIAEAFRLDSGISALFGSYDDAPGAKNFLSQYRNLLHHYVHQNSNSEAATFWAGLGAIRRTAFAEIGGFDAKKYARPSIEDIELGMRLRAAGHRILLGKNIQATHLKKWEVFSMLQTDIFSRAIPWSRLILTRKALINDLNLKKSDRLSALFVGLALLFTVFAGWQPLFLIPVFFLIFGCLYLNRRIIRFFAAQRGALFAAGAFFWQLVYFFYSGTSFVFSWFEVNFNAFRDDDFLSSESTRSN